jgi:small subunit ribosomal protein S20
MRQNETRRMRNRARRTALKTKLRQCTEEMARGAGDAAAKRVQEATRALDREAGRGTIHRNAAARRKSRLARQLKALKAKVAPA